MVLIIVCAAALAFVVLYNLTNINITERMRELATLKVLGFYDGELSAYIYRENVILTVFGVALGMGMGKLLHRWLDADSGDRPAHVRPCPASLRRAPPSSPWWSISEKAGYGRVAEDSGMNTARWAA